MNSWKGRGLWTGDSRRTVESLEGTKRTCKPLSQPQFLQRRRQAHLTKSSAVGPTTAAIIPAAVKSSLSPATAERRRAWPARWPGRCIEPSHEQMPEGHVQPGRKSPRGSPGPMFLPVLDAWSGMNRFGRKPPVCRSSLPADASDKTRTPDPGGYNRGCRNLGCSPGTVTRLLPRKSPAPQHAKMLAQPNGPGGTIRHHDRIRVLG